MIRLEEIIRRYVALHKQNKKGWHPCVHLGCDHGKKGPRAAFLFAPNGAVTFSCFNCPKKGWFDPDRHRTIPDPMKEILRDFHIPDDEWKSLELECFVRSKKIHEKEERSHQRFYPKAIKLPDPFYFLDDADPDDKWAMVARSYLESRLIPPDSYPFMMSSSRNDKWAKRLIIPMYKGRQFIYYSGRDLTGKALKKYENPLFSKDNVIFQFDKLFEFTDNPLFVLEGALDALSIPDCVAVLGNRLTEAQIDWLQSSKRDKIFIPDKKRGREVAEKALELGWSVSTPSIGASEDINQALINYGILYLIKTLNENVSSGEIGKLSVGLYCEN